MRIALYELLALMKSKLSPRNDLGKAEIRVQRWRLEKFDGDALRHASNSAPQGR